MDLIFIVGVTIVNLIGVKVMSWFNNVLIVVQIVFLAAVLLFSLKYILGGGAGTILDFSGFFNAVEYSKPDVGWTAIFGGASILAMSFLGFDSVTTIAEETIEPEKISVKHLLSYAWQQEEPSYLQHTSCSSHGRKRGHHLKILTLG